jgi:hypothetical protein
MEQSESGKKKPKKTTKIKTTDGGWGWMCVMGSFLLHTYLAGHQKSFSLLYIVMRQRFESSAAFTAWVGGTSIAVRMMCSESFYCQFPIGYLELCTQELKNAMICNFNSNSF